MPTLADLTALNFLDSVWFLLLSFAVVSLMILLLIWRDKGRHDPNPLYATMAKERYVLMLIPLIIPLNWSLIQTFPHWDFYLWLMLFLGLNLIQLVVMVVGGYRFWDAAKTYWVSESKKAAQNS